MARGRPRLAGTDAERAEARRAKVRLHVQAFRQRQKEKVNCTTGDILAHESLVVVQQHAGQNASYGTCTDSSLEIDSSIPPPHPFSDVDIALSALAENGKGDLRGMELAMHGRMMRLPTRLDASHAYRDYFFANLLDQYLPHDKGTLRPQNNHEIIPKSCSRWVASACSVAGEYRTDVLVDSLLSMALFAAGAQRGDNDLIVAGLHFYQRALVRLRMSLDTIITVEDKINTSKGVLPLAALACSISELMINKSSATFWKHVDGLALLIQRGGPSSLASPTMRDLFYEYRSMKIGYCFMERKSCFLAQREWIDFPWRSTCDHARTHFHSLLDITFPMLELVEEVTPLTIASSSPSELWNYIRQAQIYNDRLDGWKLDLESRYSTPVFQRIHSDMPPPFTARIDFGSFDIACAVLYHFTVKVYLCDLVLDISHGVASDDGAAKGVSEVAWAEGLTFANLICQSMEYCFHQDTRMVGKFGGMFPFDAAWKFFRKASDNQRGNLEPELEWCRSTAARFKRDAVGVHHHY